MCDAPAWIISYGHIMENLIKTIDSHVDGYGTVRIEEAIRIRNKSNKKILDSWYFSHRFKVVKKKISKVIKILSYFDDAPLLDIPGRMHPVEVFYTLEL